MSYHEYEVLSLKDKFMVFKTRSVVQLAAVQKGRSRAPDDAGVGMKRVPSSYS